MAALFQKKLEARFQLNLTKKPYYIADDFLYLGEIENNKSDDIDDSALVYIMQDKLFIVAGCSHAGIINIVNYAKKVTGIGDIYGILDGLHLINKPAPEIETVSEFFKQEKIEYPAPCHCCDLMSKFILAQNNKIEEICTGDIIVLN